ncbi:MAG: ATP-dependent DNA helicase RecG [Lachnospiraceae bacterium]|nr:ATP-dependent DNA helicase RecG [Lachnospiraceae bacterium]
MIWVIFLQYTDNILNIKGIGEKTAALLNKVGVFSVGDLIEYYPRNYDVFKPIQSIKDAQYDETVTIEGFITDSVNIKKSGRLTILTTRLKDSDDSIRVVWFNMPYLKNMIKLGNRFILRGKVSRNNGYLQLEQPKIISKEEYYKSVNTMTPVYSLTHGLNNTTIVKAVSQAIGELEFDKEYLPVDIRKKYNLCGYSKAVKNIHFPKTMEDMLEARKRLVFDEFFIFSLAVNRLKEDKNKTLNSYRLNKDSDQTLYKKVMDSLPFTLTNAQLKTVDEIYNDMSGEYCMNRLVQGDVGSGKTIVAILALVMIVQEGYQGALMAPTEVLALQHYESMKELLLPFGLSVVLLTGSMTVKEKKETYEVIKNHEADIIIGTHALIQEKVEYDNLGLVITDEQHRFGVRQRDIFSKKGDKPHILVMSATPIPRTLAIILYGDLDISIIDELPKDRLPIKNCVVDTSYREKAYKFIAKEVAAGRQAYVICSMIEESENIEAENIKDYVERLRINLPPFVTVEGLYGKMKPKEKNDIMERFAKNEINVLVSTTVIEVGVNVPNATVMMVEDAHRFGLAQLHQLRGRVGRGKYQSYCIFISGNDSKKIMERLGILNKSNNGFFVAEEDLKLRGPGDLFGIRQSGDISFKIGDIFNDAASLKEACEGAKDISLENIRKMIKENSWIERKIIDYSGNAIL